MNNQTARPTGSFPRLGAVPACGAPCRLPMEAGKVLETARAFPYRPPSPSTHSPSAAAPRSLPDAGRVLPSGRPALLSRREPPS